MRLIVLSPLLFLILVIWICSLFFLASLKVCKFCRSFQRTNFWFCWFYFFIIYFINFYYGFYIFFVTLSIICSSFFTSFLRKKLKPLIRLRVDDASEGVLGVGHTGLKKTEKVPVLRSLHSSSGEWRIREGG